MSARGMPARAQGLPAKPVPMVDSVRSAKPAEAELQRLHGFKRPSHNERMEMGILILKPSSRTPAWAGPLFA